MHMPHELGFHSTTLQSITLYMKMQNAVSIYLYYLVLESGDFQVMLQQVQLVKMKVAALTCKAELVLKDIRDIN